MSDLTYWRIYCITESAWVYTYNAVEPTVCPNNAAHTVNSGSVQDIQDASNTLYGVQTLVCTVDSTSLGTGALVIQNGGLTALKQIRCGGALTVANTTVSSSVGTGAIICSGGLSVAGNTYKGGILNITNTTISSSATTGALIVAGGFGASGAAYFSGITNYSGIVNVTNTTTSSSPSTGSLVISGGMGVSGPVYIGNSLSVTGTMTYSGVVNITNTTVSSSSTTGALVVTGGFGVSGSSYYSGTLNVSNTTASSSGTTGALVVTGGIGSSGNFFTTGNITSSNTAGSTVTIDCKSSTTPGGALVFSNSSGTGDYRIYGTGGDCQWVGGGSRSMQFGAYHQVIIKGGSTVSTQLAQSNGNGSTYNCQIINTNDSIALTVQSNGTQTGDLTQWTTSSATVLAKVTSVGNIVTNATTASTSTGTGSIVTSGGIGAAGNAFIGGNISTVTGGSSVNMRSVTTTYTVLTTDNFLACSTSGGSYIITLPVNSGNTGKIYYISKTSTDTNSITIDGNGSETIGGNVSLVLSIPYSFAALVATGSSDWTIMALSIPIVNNPASFTYPYGALYGAGTLGNVTISANTTLTTTSYYNNLTINSGVTLNPGGFQIVVANTLTFVSGTSTIACNGGNASGVTGGTAASPYADLVSGVYTTYLGGGTAGANGITQTLANGTNSTGYTSGNSSVAGSGGNGGNSSSRTGGTAGLVTAIAAKDGGVTLLDTLPECLGRENVGFNYIAFNGGTGGGSGAMTIGTGTTLRSGSGGGGAGLVVLVARIISAASGGVIQAMGGNGSNASAGTLGTASLGGGASGGGGIVSIITSTPYSTLSNITVSVAAGTPGTGLGTGGLSGATGSAGRIIINQV